MKTNRSRSRNPAALTNSRWLAYATAGAASAFACALSAEGTIHYSGPINRIFSGYIRATFRLDQPGDSIWLSHYSGTFPDSYAACGVHGLAGASIVGFNGLFLAYASRLKLGQLVSSGPFVPARRAGLLGQYHAQFDERGIGYIGFKFNNGSGDQYGWVRIQTRAPNGLSKFMLRDYAYGDVGDRVRTGQRGDQPDDPELESLGGLALGAVGLVAWRKRRSKMAVG
jgi:hypothetical protein